LNYCCWKNSSGRKFCKSLAITNMHCKSKTQSLHCQVFFALLLAMICLQIPFRNGI
jgi:hypothetical protein